MYYTMVGTVTAVIVGLIVSHFTGRNKNEIHRHLLSPLVYRFLKKQESFAEADDVHAINGELKELTKR